jgi:hypothetical protein
MDKGPKLKRSLDVSWRTIEGQAVLIFNREGEVQVLNELGTFVWEHAEEALEDIAGNIAETYEVTFDEALADTRRFIEELAASGALVECKD